MPDLVAKSKPELSGILRGHRLEPKRFGGTGPCYGSLIMANLIVTLDERSLVADPVLLVGVARSGTTLTGQLIGSLAEVEYEYEPWLLRQLPIFVAAGLMSRESAALLMHGHAQELLVGHMLGRNVNTRPGDDSRFSNTKTDAELRRRWSSLGDRADVEREVKARGVRLCTKLVNCHGLYDILLEAFPRAHLIVIHRHGFDTAHSLTARRLLDDDVLQHDDTVMPRRRAADGRLVPWWLESEREDEFSKWSVYTRCLHMWTSLMERHERSCADSPALRNRLLEIRYEDVVADVDAALDRVTGFLGTGTRTELTRQIAAGVDPKRDRRRRPPPDTDPGVLERAEVAMARLGY